MHQHRNYPARPYGSLDSMTAYSSASYGAATSMPSSNGAAVSGYPSMAQQSPNTHEASSSNVFESPQPQREHQQQSYGTQQISSHNGAMNAYLQHPNYQQHTQQPQQALHHPSQPAIGVYRAPSGNESPTASWHPQQQHANMRYYSQQQAHAQMQGHSMHPQHAHSQYPGHHHQVAYPQQQPQLMLKPLDAYLLARALQTAPPQRETHQIILFAQANHKDPTVLLHAYEHRRKEIDELVAQLRSEEGASQTSMNQTSYMPSPMSTTSASGLVNGASYMGSGIPPTVISLQPGVGTPHSTSVPPTSAPPSYSRTMTAPPSSVATTGDLDLPSEASSPMLETPTSAGLPSSGNGKLGSGYPMLAKYPSSALANGAFPPPDNTARPGSNHSNSLENKPNTDAAASQNSPPTSADLPTASKPGSRDGEPYTELEIRLIEKVIREAVQEQPDIKLAQLGVLIHNKDQARPATAWARQLSKRKQAIDRARELARNGKDISRVHIDVNRNLKALETDTDDAEGEEGARRNRLRGVKTEEGDDAEYDDRPHKRRRGS